MEALTGISPWWWIAAAILIAAAEMATVSFFLIWPALAALATGIAMWIYPGLTGPSQLAIFAVLSIALTFAGRALVQRTGFMSSAPTTLNRRAEQMLGRDGVVVSFGTNEGKVTIDGVPWIARLDADASTPKPADRVTVTAVEGTVITVRPV
jgi:membrane protein implicated in regulation of membrane protease activity